MSSRRAPANPPDLPGYTYERLLGSGGFADVFLYERQLPRMPVAIKVLVGSGLTEDARRKFADEANTMARLQSHPYIVGIIAADISSDGRPFIVMQYYPNDNLAIRAKRQPLSTTDALRVGIQISSAVETAHRAGVLHRDIKPANILTSEFGDHGLADFGIAGASTGAENEQSEGLSIPWSPPEAFESVSALDVRSDVYSLGATVWHLLAGRSPFEIPGGNNSQLMLMERVERSPVPTTGRPDVPPQLERVLSQAMSKNPDSRQSSALLFARDLQAVEQELHLKMTTIVVPTELRDPIRPDRDEVDESTRTRIGARIDPFPEAPRVRSQTTPGEQDPQPTRGVAPERAPVQASAVHLIEALPGVSATSSFDIAEDAATRARPRAVTPQAQVAEAAVEPRSRKGLIISVGVVVLVAGALILVFVLGGSPKTNTPMSTTGGSSPVIIAAPTPTSVSAARSGTTINVSWANPDPMKGDYYEISEYIDGQETTSVQSSTNSKRFTDVPSTVSPCFTVVLQRENGGSASNPTSPTCVSD